MAIRCLEMDMVNKYGWVKAFLVQHFHYWAENGKKEFKDKDGHMWFSTSIPDLRERGQLPSSDYTIKNALKFLIQNKLLFSERPIKNQKKNYRLNYDHADIKLYYTPPKISSGENHLTVGRKSPHQSVENHPTVGRKSPHPNITNKKQKNKTIKQQNSGGLKSCFAPVTETKEEEQELDMVKMNIEFSQALHDTQGWQEDADTPSIAPIPPNLYVYGNWVRQDLLKILKLNPTLGDTVFTQWECITDMNIPSEVKQKRVWLEGVLKNKLTGILQQSKSCHNYG